MNRQERIAWYTVVVVVLAMAVFMLLIPVLGLFRATGAFGILGLWGLSPLLAWRKHGSSEVIGDERDRAINSKAAVIGYSVFWVFFVFSCMVSYWMYGEQGSMPVEVLPIIVWLGASVLLFVWSVATIIQYRRGRQNVHG